MKTKIDIISGFLGSGKTTLIKKLIDEKLSKEKIAIIENDFGDVGIDSIILKKANIEVKEISAGCICCTLVGSFEKAIEEIITNYQPNRIIIEPSGLGQLSDVIKACEGSKHKDKLIINMLITVVDVLNYHSYIDTFGEFFLDQIKHAKTILLSRTLMTEGKGVDKVVKALQQLNKSANIISSPLESIGAERIIAVAEREMDISLMHNSDCNCGCNHQHKRRADELFEVWSTETPRIFNEIELKELINKISNSKSYGEILRGKGIVPIENGKWLQFDYVPGEFNIKDIQPDYIGRICIIGIDLKKEELNLLF